MSSSPASATAEELRKVAGTIFALDQTASHDGPGLRMVVYLKGCPLHCLWCHSPESIAPQPQIIWLGVRCAACGRCAELCPQGLVPAQMPAEERPERCLECLLCARGCPNRALVVKGERTTAGALADQARRLKPFFARTGGGLTLSGGEPLLQPEFACAIATLCRGLRIHVDVETCGFGRWGDLERLAASTELFLFDLKLLDEDRHRAFIGQSNQLILDNLRQLSRVHANIIACLPLIPDYTDDDDNVRAVAKLAEELGLAGLRLLPANPAAAGKYAWLRREYPLAPALGQTPERLRQLAELAGARGLPVTVVS